MSQKRQFHAALSVLAHARASNTLQFILEEARRIERECRRRVSARDGPACHRCSRRHRCRAFVIAFQPDKRRIIE